MKIVFLDAATLGNDIDLSPIEKLGVLTSYDNSLKDQVKSRIKDADVVIVNKINLGAEEFEAAPNLKLVCVAATGTNNIDMASANKAGIKVMNVVDYSTESVAQVTFASLLSLICSIGYYDNVVKSGAYSQSQFFTDSGRSFQELKGKCFGIIGMGNIGKRVASIASSFGCKVYYYSTNGIAHCKDYPSVSLEELLQKSDVISIHSPLNEKTKNLISLKEMKEMKTSAVLINMGRGGIVNESDLVQSLNFGLIAGAVIDVYEDEPIKSNHPYMKIKDKEKVILTPHIGWASIEARKVLVDKLAENIKSVI
ncbi:MAG: D-2-hydroxyacid dehydrogenase [Bacteroidales bacterium]|jgi:glycerate dehydrogenase|nr:D-2-hydroxyacid dehydrogenase [Bacteroidales bacterium]MDD3299793.1 D-2-hydroxyacid dehydrogenase [Bacteroidales bacterium]MDD3843414.1 D-2-hydroxyacid dehydrogenase [Bacteroidales bacterium]MDD4617664.1 D-2-hydroxyacid dehydrogenase [Bacteroidales bacterium]